MDDGEEETEGERLSFGVGREEALNLKGKHFVPVSNVNQELVYTMYQIHLRLLSSFFPHLLMMKIKAEKSVKYIFTHYSIARLSLLIQRYQEMEIEENESVDYSPLRTNEWILIHSHVSDFKSRESSLVT